VATVGTFFHKVLDDPLVFSISAPALFVSGFSVCVKESGGKPFNALVFLHWWAPDIFPEVNAFYLAAKQNYPEANIVFVCATRAETDGDLE